MIYTNIVNPTLTIAIPTYSEAANIERVLRGLLSTKYPNLIEVFVADGDSTDGTQDIVNKISAEDSRVKLIHNPLKIQSAALNQMLQDSSGDIYLRLDAHCEYAPDYIEKSVEALLESEAMDAGGAQRFVAKNYFQAGIALATKSFLGSGRAKYRDPNYDGYADTVFLGCFWRKDLLEMSGYSVARNEDAELCLRLIQKNKNAIYISSQIKVWYYPRNTWIGLWRQYVKYGRGRCLTHIKHPSIFHLRSRLPVILLPIMGLLSILTILSHVLYIGLHLEVLIVLARYCGNSKYREKFKSADSRHL
jgi:cellulose synthase/poly-beta-1,6-N-acetylglucosamine synthase-like glycosyltransferase